MANKGLIYIGVSLFAIGVAGTYLQSYEPKQDIDAQNTKMVDQGEPLYDAYCAACHGRNLEGESPDWRSVKEDGTLPAPPHDETGHTWHHDDKLLFEYTKLGGAALGPDGFKSAMPGFKDVLNDTEIRAVLAYIKSRWPKDVQDKQAIRNAAATD